jgi:hypothetical protein
MYRRFLSSIKDCKLNVHKKGVSCTPSSCTMYKEATNRDESDKTELGINISLVSLFSVLYYGTHTIPQISTFMLMMLCLSSGKLTYSIVNDKSLSNLRHKLKNKQ